MAVSRERWAAVVTHTGSCKQSVAVSVIPGAVGDSCLATPVIHPSLPLFQMTYLVVFWKMRFSREWKTECQVCECVWFSISHYLSGVVHSSELKQEHFMDAFTSGQQSHLLVL